MPSTIARSSSKVQRTYRKALDSAHEQYGSEERAHRTAYAAVEHVTKKKKKKKKKKKGDARRGRAAEGLRPSRAPATRRRSPERA